MITDLKPGDKVLLHTESFLREKYTRAAVYDMIYRPEVGLYLGKEVTIREFSKYKEPSFYIEGTVVIIEVRMVKEKVTQEEKGNTMNSLKERVRKDILERPRGTVRIEKTWLIDDSELDSIKSVMMDSMLKAMTAAKPAKAKFLTLNVVNGQANVKEMIHQAYFADIIDPRPFIQDMLKRELTRLHTYLETIAPLKSNLGFNLKLRGMFETLLDIVKKPVKSMTTEDAVRVYEFQKEYDNYQAAVQANNGVCPYQWVEAHLTHDNLNSTKTVELFISNKIQIFIKNGLIIYREETPKANYRFETEIKFSVAENKFSL